jgi:tetratricopeptide (TPR) repeat protein
MFLSLHLFSQKTVIFEDPGNTYNQALDLFQQENYGAAAILFDQVREEINDPTNSFSENSSYYSTISAVYLGEKNALKKVENFKNEYPESPWLPAIYFQLGNLYFNNKKYRDAINSFHDVRPNQLSKDQRQEYYYKLGYSELQLDKEDAALKSFSKVSDPKSAFAGPAEYYTAHIYYVNGDYEKALEGFKGLENDRRYAKYIPNYLINIYYELGDYQKVIDEGTVYIDKADSKTQSEIAGLIANAYYNLDDYEKSLEYFDLYERIIRKEITPATQYRIGYVKFLNERYKAAIYNFQEASKGDEKYTQNAWYHLGFCYLNTDQPKFAQSAFLKAYKLNGDKKLETDALYNYVKITIELGSDPFNDPVEIVQEFIQKNPDLPRIDEAYDLLAQLYLTSKKYDAALASIEKTRNPNIKLQAIYQQIAYAQGVEYFNQGKYDEAINYFEKSLYYTPNQQLAENSTFWYADALYRQKQFSESSKKYWSFLQMPGSTQNPLYPDALYNQGYTYFNLKQYPNAVTYFNKFLARKSDNIRLVNDAKLRLADSYFISKDYPEAMKWYEQVIKNGNGEEDYAIYQKAFCYGAQGQFEAKINTLLLLVKGYPASPLYDDALYEIASTNLTLKDQRGAIVYFDKLTKEKPNSALAKKALIKMGFIYYNGNQYDQAIKTLKMVVDKYPASLEATEALKTLQNVYMDMGQVDKYFAYAKGLDFVQVSTSEEDSLTFVSGENYYTYNDCDNAIPAFKKYLQQFPNGGFVLSAYNYLSLCYEAQENPGEAMIYYQKIIEFPNNQFTDKALLKAARYEFDNKNYIEARQYYEKLNVSAEDQGMILEARDGSMRCSYLMEDYRGAKQYADQLINTPNATDEQLIFAYFVAAQTNLQTNNIAEAEKYFSLTNEMASNELGAESLYQLALINFNRNQLDEAENLIYSLPENYPSSDYWIAKAFILLADIYVARDNVFQAEQTLESVIANYPGEDLKEVARQKLEEIKPEPVETVNPDDEIEND